MSEHIEFTPNGLVLHKWSASKRKYVKKKPKKTTIVTHLRSRCEIAEGTTLKHIFETVDQYKFLKAVVSQYSWCHHIDEFHAQAQEPKYSDSDPDNETKLEYLEIYHSPEVHKFTEKKRHPGGTRERTITVDFETQAEFHGIGLPTKDYPSMRPDGKVVFGVSYSPMWELADLPVKLNKSFDVYEPFDSSKHNRNTKQEILLTSKREFSLLEVLDAIYWDISFMGGPQENAKFIEEMKDDIQKINDGTMPLIPIEQVFTDLKDKPSETKVLMHPDVARFFGCDPDSIPLDDKEIIKNEKEDNSI